MYILGVLGLGCGTKVQKLFLEGSNRGTRHGTAKHACTWRFGDSSCGTILFFLEYVTAMYLDPSGQVSGVKLVPQLVPPSTSGAIL